MQVTHNQIPLNTGGIDGNYSNADGVSENNYGRSFINDVVLRVAGTEQYQKLMADKNEKPAD